MVMALLLIGIASGLGAGTFALLAGWGFLAAICAYILGGMGGMVLGILASLPFHRDPDAPARANRDTDHAAPAMA